MDYNATLDLPAEDVRALESMRSRLMPLVYNIERMRDELQQSGDAPPNWPAIHRATSLLNSHMKSLHDYLNAEVTTDTSQTNAQLLSRLRPYPIAPFNTVEKFGIVETLTRKKVEPHDETWIENRIRKAAEFCDVPSDWNIEPRSGNAHVSEGGAMGMDDDDRLNEHDIDEDEDDPYGGFKRTKTNLDEEQISQLWRDVPPSTQKTQQEFRDAIKGEPTVNDTMTRGQVEAILDRLYEIREKIGLSGKQDDERMDEDEEDEDEDEEDGAATAEQGAVPLGMLLKFMSTGDTKLPLNVGF